MKLLQTIIAYGDLTDVIIGFVLFVGIWGTTSVIINSVKIPCSRRRYW